MEFRSIYPEPPQAPDCSKSLMISEDPMNEDYNGARALEARIKFNGPGFPR